MTEPIPRSRYPIWVKLSLLGLPGRGGLWAFVVLSWMAAIACTAYGFRDSRFFYLPVPFVLAAFLYWSAIRWVDRYGSWDA
jgi:hypothetical protein